MMADPEGVIFVPLVNAEPKRGVRFRKHRRLDRKLNLLLRVRGPVLVSKYSMWRQ